MLKQGDKIRITKILENDGYWEDFGIAEDEIYIVDYVGEKVFRFGGNGAICYIEGDTDFEYEIVKENDSMKELTFREVEEIIKLNQIWESDSAKLYLNKKLELIVELKNNKSANAFVISNEAKYKLIKNTVSFAEAFEAYEKGKEIESCATGFIYSKRNETNFMREEKGIEYGWNSFDVLEIRGGWYIND